MLTRGARREERTTSVACPPTSRRSTVDRPGNPSPGWYLTTFGVAKLPSDPAGRVQRDLRQPRRARLVQAHAGARARLQTTVERHVGLRAAARSGASGSIRRAGYLITRPRRVARRGADRTVGSARWTRSLTRPTSTTTSSCRAERGGRAMLSYPAAHPDDLSALERAPSAGAVRPAQPGHVSVLGHRPRGRRRDPGDRRQRQPRVGLGREPEHVPDTDSTFPNRFDVPLYNTPARVSSICIT